MRIWKKLFGERSTESGDAVEIFHRTIIETATKKLHRDLSPEEMRFVTSRRGFIALEMISDTVEAAGAEELLGYLNSERPT
jgi:hypothetical protein